MKQNEIKSSVREIYSEIAKNSVYGGCSQKISKCCCDSKYKEISKNIGYSEDEISNVPEADLGLGCGNPTALSDMKEGEVVLDLGSGAGFDAFLAARKVGKMGKVIGVDMTLEMIEKAKNSAKKHGFSNVEFRLGDIESLPVDSESIDVIISNCVINLAPDKDKVFREAFRVLKSGGRMFVSDIVLLSELSPEQRADKILVAGCVGGALLKEDYLKKVVSAGFKYVILGEDKKISKRQYEGINLESLKLKIWK